VKSHEDIQFNGVKWHSATIKESPFSQALSGSHRPRFVPPNGDLDEQRTETLGTDADIPSWLPGDNVFDSAVTLPAGLVPGEYELAIALLDPRSTQPKIKLAIQGGAEDGWHRLGILKVAPQ
jgi:hypothetical protein